MMGNDKTKISMQPFTGNGNAPTLTLPRRERELN